MAVTRKGNVIEVDGMRSSFFLQADHVVAWHGLTELELLEHSHSGPLTRVYTTTKEFVLPCIVHDVTNAMLQETTGDV